MNDFRLGKRATQEVSVGQRQRPGQPVLIDATGVVVGSGYDDEEAALRDAKRIARKTDDDVYVYIATRRVGPSEPKIEEEQLGAAS